MQKLGVQNGQLTQCSSKPNCVCSQAKDEAHFIEPILSKGTQKQTKDRLVAILNAEKRAKIKAADSDYIKVEFASKIFRFVDDVEFYFPDTGSTERLIQVRSASRVGYSDLGVNRKRIESIRQQLNSKS
ncbi:MAG: DUF1499 domain-containing protein [Paraglaciecola sp.]|uniref:DUF1499 domain-containing protein n=1 Tax=Paraglaciecola sp. TaxID=1920173 RepID=UPI003296AD38